jgi:A/G-specific adenine glycosylase
MRALPTGPWSDTPPGLAGAPEGHGWKLIDGTVSHGFTHFTLDLALAVGTAVSHAEGEWWPIGDIESAGLPTVFAKAAMTIRGAISA